MASCTPAPRRCRRGTRRHKLPRGQLTPWCLTACVRGNLAALGRLTVRGAAASASARERGRGGQRSRRLHQRGTPADHQHTRVLQCPAAPRCTAPPLQPGGAGQAHSEAERLRRHQHAREGEVGKGRDACTCEARQQTTSTPACCNVQQRHAAPPPLNMERIPALRRQRGLSETFLSKSSWQNTAPGATCRPHVPCVPSHPSSAAWSPVQSPVRTRRPQTLSLISCCLAPEALRAIFRGAMRLAFLRPRPKSGSNERFLRWFLRSGAEWNRAKCTSVLTEGTSKKNRYRFQDEYAVWFFEALEPG